MNSAILLKFFLPFQFIKKESPDVETPGLLVKALISSYFMMSDV